MLCSAMPASGAVCPLFLHSAASMYTCLAVDAFNLFHATVTYISHQIVLQLAVFKLVCQVEVTGSSTDNCDGAVQQHRDQPFKLLPHRVVWIDSMPLPLRTDEHIFSFRDKRTTPRLTLFNRIADSLLNVYLGAHRQSRRVSLLSFFDMAQSVMDAGSPDDAHLIGYTPALDAMIDALMTTLCEDFEPS